MLQLAGYTVSDRIHRGAKSFLYRARQQEDDLSVVLKVSVSEYPSDNELARIRKEFETLKQLGSDNVLKAYELIPLERRLVMVVEDFGAQSLQDWIRDGGGGLAERLRIAIGASRGLGELHAQHVIHKDINPANILYDGSGTTKVADLDIATVLSRENPEVLSPRDIEGTLLYISPEQTGRMNRPMDYRTDLYSFGVTLYELFTGELPFQSSDPLELVHAHIARPPVPPTERAPDVPQALSDIVMRLLAKTAESRYQSSAGLRADLEACLQQLEATGSVQVFPLGSQDRTERFEIPHELYGRQAELDLLTQAFERISRPGERAALVTVAGPAGIGKSMLTGELHKPVTGQRGYFIAGKFDQFQRTTPYSALASAFSSLVQQLLGESEAELAQWREALDEALGPNAAIVIDIIPELALILPHAAPAAQVGSNEAQNRFNLVFRNFLRVFAQPEHPLVMFLDDLQWADSGSLKLLELILSDEEPQALLIAGAFRDNEVGPAHPLRNALAKLRGDGVQIAEITLGPLSPDDVDHLVADSVGCTVQAAQDLSRLVAAKTDGNPLFVTELLKTIYEEGLLRLERGSGRWTWDLAQIEAEAITDNVVELMLSKLRQLPDTAQRAMFLAACLGGSFELETLAMAAGSSEATVFDEMLPAIQHGYVIARSGLVAGQAEEGPSRLVISRLRFMHDRVQQAAYGLVPEDQRPQLHLRIGRTLRALTPPEHLPEQLFGIVDQLNHGRSLMGEDELTELAALNLLAAQRAQGGLAYDAARSYLQVAKQTLGDRSWQDHYELTRQVYRSIAEVETLLNDHDAAEQVIRDAMGHVRTELERADFYSLLSEVYMRAARYDDALTTTKEGAEMLGLVLPMDAGPEDLYAAVGASMGAVFGHVGERDIMSLADGPEMTDPVAIAQLELIKPCMPASFFRNPLLYAVLNFECVSLMLQHGHSPDSLDLYSNVGHAIGGVTGNWPVGDAFGRLALSLSDRFQVPHARCRSHFIHGNFVSPWARHYRESRPLNVEGYRSGIDSGDLLYAGYCLIYQPYQAWYCGDALSEVARDLPEFTAFNARTSNLMGVDVLRCMDIVVQNMQGLTSGPTSFDLDNLTEADFLSGMQARGSTMAQAFYPVLKGEVLYMHGHPAQALALLTENAPMLAAIMGHPCTAYSPLFSALSMAALHNDVDEAQQVAFREGIAGIAETFAAISANGPENWTHPLTLIQAELARIEGRDTDAAELYDTAIDQASAAGFGQHEALANELAARYWLGRGRRRAARAYMAEAVHGYQLRGAVRKVALLEERFAELMPRTVRGVGSTQVGTTAIGTTTTTSGRGGQSLDLDSFIRASQAITSEIVLDRLLATLMRVVIQTAGAQQGCLVLDDEGQLNVHVVARLGDGGEVEVKVLSAVALGDFDDACEEIVRYTARTRKNLLLDDASAEGSFTKNAYVMQRQPRSVLCTSLMRQNALVGALYLENNVASRAFTPDRVEVLRLLSTQVAIAIENARLFSKTDEMARSFSRFVPREFLEHLGKRDVTEVVRGDAVQREMSVLFSDIRGFTTLSETMSPRELFGFLNDYLERVGPVIRANGGFIDKFIGDAVMALFPGQGVDAVSAGLALLRQVEAFNVGRADPIRVGVGIHYGSLMLGTIGEQQRIDSTVISDAVNTAARLEELTKKLGTSMLVSFDALALLPDRGAYEHRFVGSFRPRGRSSTIEIYQFYGAEPETRRQAMSATKANMEQGVRAYVDGELSTAQQAFEHVLSVDPVDPTARFYQGKVAEALRTGSSGANAVTASKDD